MSHPLRIAVVANTAWYLHNFRRNLMRSLQNDGHHVIAVGGEGAFAQRLREQGFEHHAVPFSGAGTKPWHELATVLALRRVLRRERVDLVLSYTPKGNLYAALADRGCRAVNLVGGGTARFSLDAEQARAVRRAAKRLGLRVVGPDRARRGPASHL